MKCSDIITDIPKEILDAYKKVHLDIDIMFVNKCAYFTAILQHIGLIHCCAIVSCTNKQVVNIMQCIIEQYSKRGFTIATVHRENQFDDLNEWMTNKKITLVTCDTDAHVPTIERTNQFLKERIRCTRMDIPFFHVPKRLLVKVVKRVTILVKSIPRKVGLHAALSPREIITGKNLQIPKYKIRQYVQGHVKTMSNTGEEQSVDSLYLGPADNGCGYIVFKLQTKQPISVPQVTLIPMTNDIINRVNQMGKDKGEQEGIVCTEMFGKATLNDLDYSNYNVDDDDSNVLDNSYVFNEK